MIRNSDRNRNKPDENDQNENVTLNKGAKQFRSEGLNKSFMTNTTPSLKVKHNYKSEDNGNSQKQKMIPLKRTESAVGLKHYSESKRQTVDKTYRRVEQENEWAPEGFDLDFSNFDSQVYDRKEIISDIMDDELPIPQRAFAVTENMNKDDTVSVEYGPPREIELPYEPEPSCVVDVSNFSDYADVSAYEVVRLLGKDLLEFNSLQDHDVLDALSMQLYEHDEFEFEFESDSELDMTYQEDLDVPFNDYLFDVEHFLQCN